MLIIATTLKPPVLKIIGEIVDLKIDGDKIQVDLKVDKDIITDITLRDKILVNFKIDKDIITDISLRDKMLIDYKINGDVVTDILAPLITCEVRVE